MSNSSREYFDQMENQIENNMNDIDRDAEAHGWANAQPNANFDLQVAKESLIPTVESTIQTLINGVEDGEINALDVFATFDKLVKTFNEAKQKVEKDAIHEASHYDKSFVFCGVGFTSKQGGYTLKYEEDFLIKELQEKIKQRQELLKVARKTKEPLYDSDGIEVTKVSLKPTKSSLTVKFKN